MNEIQNASADFPVPFKLVDATTGDPITGATLGSIDIKILLNGELTETTATSIGTNTDEATLGRYWWYPAVGDLDIYGRAVIRINYTGADEIEFSINVVEEVPWLRMQSYFNTAVDSAAATANSLWKRIDAVSSSAFAFAMSTFLNHAVEGGLKMGNLLLQVWSGIVASNGPTVNKVMNKDGTIERLSITIGGDGRRTVTVVDDY